MFSLFCFSFVCDGCLKKTGRTRKENKFSAKSKILTLAEANLNNMLRMGKRWLLGLCRILSFLELKEDTFGQF